MVRISVIVITYNEEKHLARCLASVSGIADEILVVDSHSTDATATIAVSYGARVVQHVFEGYARQKNYGTSLAANDWILSLDADEEVTPALRESILRVKQAPAHHVYKMPRMTSYCSKWIKHAGWYPDHQTRLYDRTKGAWQDKKVHEYWKAHNEADRTGLLAGDLLHYSFDSISQHLRKIERYTELAAQDAVERGKTASVLKVIFSPFWHFVSEYFVKLGFLDGFHGFVICRLSAYAAFAKYSKIRMYSKQRREK
ncbi:glycosyltransferase family 2 protein [Nemorincola caseinilytica]|uniref:Glycosyltransferase family 2 protein n=1 Tax=Nemorincola caseinilytica TaxID=2054315 RepID=A0ABP8NQD7_9BACT